MEQGQVEKWEGKVSAKLSNTKADEAWSLLCNFGSFHLWLPVIETCRMIAGEESQPGCVRYCAAAPGDNGEQVVYWANEELLDFDHVGRSYSYRITDNNMGFERYVATLKVLPLPDGEGGCELEWSFDTDPLQAWSKEGFVAYLQTGIEGMAKRVEEALQPTASAVSNAQGNE